MGNRLTPIIGERPDGAKTFGVAGTATGRYDAQRSPTHAPAAARRHVGDALRLRCHSRTLWLTFAITEEVWARREPYPTDLPQPDRSRGLTAWSTGCGHHRSPHCPRVGRNFHDGQPWPGGFPLPPPWPDCLTSLGRVKDYLRRPLRGGFAILDTTSLSSGWPV
jgi:hypothetical protein